MGDNIYLGDRNGVRTPMQWSADRNAGFSRANPQQLYLPVIIDPEYHYEAVNVEAQQNNPHSLLWWMKRLIALRKQLPGVRPRHARVPAPENRKVLAFVRALRGRDASSSSPTCRASSQYVELDLSRSRGHVPVELFGRTRVPADRRAAVPAHARPARLLLVRARAARPRRRSHRMPPRPSCPRSTIAATWETLLERPRPRRRSRRLLAGVPRRRGAGSAARRGRSQAVAVDGRRCPLASTAATALPGAGRASSTPRASPRPTSLPLGVADGERAAQVAAASTPARSSPARRADGGDDGVAATTRSATTAASARRCSTRSRARRRFAARTASSSACRDAGLRAAARRRRDAAAAARRRRRAEQHARSSSATGCMLKLFRRLEDGRQPRPRDRPLPHRAGGFAARPPLAGALEYRRRRRRADARWRILQAFVAERGRRLAATRSTSSSRYFERALARARPAPPRRRRRRPLDSRAGRETPPPPVARADRRLPGDRRALLGQRTAELHLALASRAGRSRRSRPSRSRRSTSARSTSRCATLTGQTLRRSCAQRLARAARRTPAELARRLLALRGRRSCDASRAVVERTHRRRSASAATATTTSARCSTPASDFVIIDFEGEPARPLERAAHQALAAARRGRHAALVPLRRATRRCTRSRGDGGAGRATRRARAVGARLVARGSAAPSCGAYLRRWPAPAGFLPATTDERRACCSTRSLLEKALYELGYELEQPARLGAHPAARHPRRSLRRPADRDAQRSDDADGPESPRTPRRCSTDRRPATCSTRARHCRLYEKLGAHPTTRRRRGRHLLRRLGAERRATSRVVGDFNGWDQRRHPLRAARQSSGIWEGFVPGVGAGRALQVPHRLAPRRLPRRQGRPVRASTHEVPPRTALGRLGPRLRVGRRRLDGERAARATRSTRRSRSTRCTSARGGACPRRATAR